jgi:hypothetical protein
MFFLWWLNECLSYSVKWSFGAEIFNIMDLKFIPNGNEENSIITQSLNLNKRLKSERWSVDRTIIVWNANIVERNYKIEPGYQFWNLIFCKKSK